MCFLYVSAYVRMHIPFQVMPKQVGELERVSRVSMSQSPPKLKLPTYYIFVVNEVKLLLTVGIEICECYYVNCSLFYYFPDTRTLPWVLLLVTAAACYMLLLLLHRLNMGHNWQLAVLACSECGYFDICAFTRIQCNSHFKKAPILYCMHKCTCT